MHCICAKQREWSGHEPPYQFQRYTSSLWKQKVDKQAGQQLPHSKQQEHTCIASHPNAHHEQLIVTTSCDQMMGTLNTIALGCVAIPYNHGMLFDTCSLWH